MYHIHFCDSGQVRSAESRRPRSRKLERGAVATGAGRAAASSLEGAREEADWPVRVPLPKDLNDVLTA